MHNYNHLAAFLDGEIGPEEYRVLNEIDQTMVSLNHPAVFAQIEMYGKIGIA